MDSHARWVVVAAATVLSFAPASVSAGSYSSLAADDGHVEGTTAGYTALDTDLFVALVLDWTLSSARREALFEYDLTSIPAGVTLTAATWRIQTSSENGTFDVHGYAGDGVLELVDASVANNAVASFTGGLFGIREIPLDLQWVQQLLDSGLPALGLAVRGRDGLDSSLQISTKEISSADARAARLILEYEEATAAPPRKGIVFLPPAPNPFNPTTELRFVLPHAGQVRLQVLDARGRIVRTLVDEVREGGPQAVLWRGLDDRGCGVASGTYLAVLSAPGVEGERRAVTRLTLVR